MLHSYLSAFLSVNESLIHVLSPATEWCLFSTPSAQRMKPEIFCRVFMRLCATAFSCFQKKPFFLEHSSFRTRSAACNRPPAACECNHPSSLPLGIGLVPIFLFHRNGSVHEKVGVLHFILLLAWVPLFSVHSAGELNTFPLCLCLE